MGAPPLLRRCVAACPPGRARPRCLDPRASAGRLRPDPREAGRQDHSARSSRPTTGGTRTSAGCRCTPAAPTGSRTCRPTSTCTPTSARRTATDPTTASRSPWSTRATSGSRCVLLRLGERQGEVPARPRHPDRGRPRLGRRQARDRRRQGRGASSTRSTTPASVDGRWKGGSGAVWSLKRNKLRPDGWTSADAAGLPILPGLLRLNEVKAEPDRPRHPVHHRRDLEHHLWPARHHAGSTDDLELPADGRAVPAQGRRTTPPASRPTPSGSSRR